LEGKQYNLTIKKEKEPRASVRKRKEKQRRKKRERIDNRAGREEKAQTFHLSKQEAVKRSRGREIEEGGGWRGKIFVVTGVKKKKKFLHFPETKRAPLRGGAEGERKIRNTPSPNKRDKVYKGWGETPRPLKRGTPTE